MPVMNYIWDVESDSYLMETDQAGATAAVYTNEPTHFGRLVSQRRDAASHFDHYDALGSTTELSDVAGDVTDTYRYDAWGNTVEMTGSAANTRRYVGETGYV